MSENKKGIIYNPWTGQGDCREFPIPFNGINTPIGRWITKGPPEPFPEPQYTIPKDIPEDCIKLHCYGFTAPAGCSCGGCVALMGWDKPKYGISWVAECISNSHLILFEAEKGTEAVEVGRQKYGIGPKMGEDASFRGEHKELMYIGNYQI